MALNRSTSHPTICPKLYLACANADTCLMPVRWQYQDASSRTCVRKVFQTLSACANADTCLTPIRWQYQDASSRTCVRKVSQTLSPHRASMCSPPHSPNTSTITRALIRREGIHASWSPLVRKMGRTLYPLCAKHVRERKRSLIRRLANRASSRTFVRKVF